jgi:hypothetical protein
MGTITQLDTKEEHESSLRTMQRDEAGRRVQLLKAPPASELQDAALQAVQCACGEGMVFRKQATATRI